MSQQGFRDTPVNTWEGLAHENYQNISSSSIIHIPGILKWTVAPDSISRGVVEWVFIGKETTVAKQDF